MPRQCRLNFLGEVCNLESSTPSTYQLRTGSQVVASPPTGHAASYCRVHAPVTTRLLSHVEERELAKGCVESQGCGDHACGDKMRRSMARKSSRCHSLGTRSTGTGRGCGLPASATLNLNA